MPTPDDETLFPPLVPASALPRSIYTTCPPEDIRQFDHTSRDDSSSDHITATESPMPVQPPVDTPQASAGVAESHSHVAPTPSRGVLEPPQDTARDTPSPVSIEESPNNDSERSAMRRTPSKPYTHLPPSFQIPDPPIPRPMPQHTSSLLRHGSKFEGTQQSDRQIYNVQVEIKHVDMAQSFICGYLRIEGLTNEHPTLTTYFEGEIIGTKYSFHTRHAEWGSNEKVDMQHWNRFPAWRPLARQARRADFVQKNYAERENIFMRWKEYFLVPDHRVRTISGASFEGFYYICFNQVRGTVSGIYFHSKSEK